MSDVVDHIAGKTFHGRRGAIENAFRYGIDYVMLDAERAVGAPWLFGRNRAGFFSLWDRDHGGAPKNGRGAEWARQVLAAHDLAEVCDGKLFLLAQPRVLGHVFNPVSFWLAQDRQGRLRAVIAEVSNTFGDRHSYLCAHHDRRPIGREDTLNATKIFHVSPFQPVEGGYAFRFDIRPDRVGVWIEFSTGNEALHATLTGPRRTLTTGSILRAALRRPFGSRRVLGLIHWQALKLWWKGARYRVRPEPPVEDVSR
jgi:DUF1365 family protein